MADVLFTSQALDATARLLPMFAVTATAKHLVAKAKGNVCETPLPLTTPHCLYTYKQAKSVRLIVDTIIHVVGNKFSCCNCTAVSRNTCRCNKAKAFSCEAYREYKFAFSACCASDNSPLLITNSNITRSIIGTPIRLRPCDKGAARNGLSYYGVTPRLICIDSGYRYRKAGRWKSHWKRYCRFFCID